MFMRPFAAVSMLSAALPEVWLTPPLKSHVPVPFAVVPVPVRRMDPLRLLGL